MGRSKCGPPQTNKRPRSLNRNAFCRDVASHLEKEVSVWVVEIQGERSTVRIPVVTERENFTEVDGSLEASVRVVHPHAVSKLVSQRSYFLPCAQADVTGPWINVWVVNLSPANVPCLEGFLDSLTSDCERGVPKANNRQVDRAVTRRRRARLHRTGWTVGLMNGSRGSHRG